MKVICLSFLLFFISVQNAFSLSCASATLEEQISSARDIFEGEIVEIISAKDLRGQMHSPWEAEWRYEVKMNVLKIYKGSERASQAVTFSFKPETGDKYIIINNSAFSSLCNISLSRKIENAEQILSLLEN